MLPRFPILTMLIFLLSCSTVRTGQITNTLPDLPNNIILLIGDGMGLSQISAALYSSRKNLALEEFTYVGLQKTHCKDELITDSAASATAISRGVKANYNAFGSDHIRRAPQSLIEIAEEMNMPTGITVTSSLTHATPAAFVTYQEFRSMNEGIASDYLNLDIDFLVGGGKKYFDRRQNDTRNLIEELEERNYQVNTYLDIELRELGISPKKNLAYFTADSEPLSHMAGRDYFIDACNIGVKYLNNKSNQGFFYLIESSQIDWGGHANEVKMVLDEIAEFNTVIHNMLTFAKKDGKTLLIVTADHETGGLSIIGEKEKHKLDIAFSTKQHTATMVPVFAYGPGANMFSGVYDNTEIYSKIRRLLQP
ncbi:MAG: alkaline phosphatase [Saprospiraceae bacterium]|nr:alkaline phosphatase [Saprospiraceae bacterium]